MMLLSGNYGYLQMMGTALLALPLGWQLRRVAGVRKRGSVSRESPRPGRIAGSSRGGLGPGRRRVRPFAHHCRRPPRAGPALVLPALRCHGPGGHGRGGVPDPKLPPSCALRDTFWLCLDRPRSCSTPDMRLSCQRWRWRTSLCLFAVSCVRSSRSFRLWCSVRRSCTHGTDDFRGKRRPASSPPRSWSRRHAPLCAVFANPVRG